MMKAYPNDVVLVTKADATDLTSAIALVNELKQRIIILQKSFNQLNSELRKGDNRG